MSFRPRAVEIEQQLAQLRWRRLQNERSIKNYLETTKVMKQKDTILGLSVDQSAEKIDWLDSVVRDELARPLVLNDTELHQVEYDDNRMKNRLVRYSQKQLDSLDKLIERTRSQEMRTADGKRIQAEQLARFAEIRQKLQDNLHEVKNQQPYIKVKYAVSKLF
eukprot:gene37605-45681_t